MQYNVVIDWEGENGQTRSTKLKRGAGAGATARFPEILGNRRPDAI